LVASKQNMENFMNNNKSYHAIINNFNQFPHRLLTFGSFFAQNSVILSNFWSKNCIFQKRPTAFFALSIFWAKSAISNKKNHHGYLDLLPEKTTTLFERKNKKLYFSSHQAMENNH